MTIEGAQTMGFGDLRREIINDINAVRRGELSIPKATAMGQLYRELNSNIQVEINAAKMALATEGKAHTFGRVVGMGRRLIGNSPEQESDPK